MSEIQRKAGPYNRITIGNNRSGDWHSLRLLVSRTSNLNLTVALITRTYAGYERLDGEIRGIQVPWDGKAPVPELRYYALRQALIGLTQTRP